MGAGRGNRVRIVITASGSEAAQKVGQTLAAMKGQLAQFEGAAKSSTSGASESFDRVGTSSTLMSQAVKAAVAVASVAFARMAASMAVDAVKASAELTGLADAWGRLASSVGVDAGRAVEAIRAATGGTITSVDAMRFASQAFLRISGLTVERAAGIAKIVQEQSLLQQREFSAVAESLVSGLATGSSAVLENFGIMVQGVTGASERIKLAMEEVDRRLEEMGDTSGGTSERFRALVANVEELKNSFLLALGQSTALRDALSAVSAGAGELAVNVRIVAAHIDSILFGFKAFADVLQLVNAATGALIGVVTLVPATIASVLKAVTIDMTRFLNFLATEAIGGTLKLIELAAGILPEAAAGPIRESLAQIREGIAATQARNEAGLAQMKADTRESWEEMASVVKQFGGQMIEEAKQVADSMANAAAAAAIARTLTQNPGLGDFLGGRSGGAAPGGARQAFGRDGFFGGILEAASDFGRRAARILSSSAVEETARSETAFDAISGEALRSADVVRQAEELKQAAIFSTVDALSTQREALAASRSIGEERRRGGFSLGQVDTGGAVANAFLFQQARRGGLPVFGAPQQPDPQMARLIGLFESFLAQGFSFAQAQQQINLLVDGRQVASAVVGQVSRLQSRHQFNSF